MRRFAVLAGFTLLTHLLTPGTSAMAATPGKTPATSAPAKGGARTHLDARLYLTWNAPYGDPRAVTEIEAPCDDTSRVDTLFLSMDPGRDAPEFRGLTATLYFHPAEGAELPARWKGGGTGVDGSPLRVVFDADSARGFETLWESRALGAPKYDFVSSSGRLRLIYANPAGTGPGLRGGRVYGVARILVRRAAAGVEGCDAPLCVEWFSSGVGYAWGEDRSINRGQRHVSMNSPQGEVCRKVREVIGVEPWKPGRR